MGFQPRVARLIEAGLRRRTGLGAKRMTGVLVTAALAMSFAAHAEAAPSLKDARAATHAADRSLAATVRAAHAGKVGAASAGVARTGRLEAKAARIARRASAHRSPSARSRHLRRAAAGVDRGFDGFAGLLADSPAPLQESLIDELGDLGDLRDQLVGQLTGLLDDLPADQRAEVLGAIAAFENDGDIDALLDALDDPALSSALQVELEELLSSLSADLQDQLDLLGDLGDLLPAVDADEIAELIDELGGNLDDILGGLGGLIGDGDGGLPGDDCTELAALFEELGIELPADFCG
jgi:hypothetical protein